MENESILDIFDDSVNDWLETVIEDGFEGATSPAPAPVRGSVRGGVALPCLLVHNVTRQNQKASEKASKLSAKWNSKKDAAKADRTPENRLGKPVSNNRDKKSAETLFLNAGHLLKRNLNGCAFVTITTPANLSYWTKEGWREARNRFRSWIGHKTGLPFVFGPDRDFCRVIEPQRRGAIHWHLVIDCGVDIRSGVDWEAFRAGDYRSAPPALRAMWSRMRESAKKYRLGRTEIMPIRSGAWEAAARYVGKYISKGIVREFQEACCEGVYRPKHSRRIGYSVGWRVASMNFAWLESGRDWRRGVELLAAHVGAADVGDLKTVLGPKWALLNRDVILHGLPDFADPESETPF